MSKLGYKFVWVIGLFCFSLDMNSAELEKISKERDQILINPDLGEQFQVGNEVCIEGRGWKEVCGKITRRKGRKAIAKMDEPLQGVKLGDPIWVGRPLRAGRSDENADWTTDTEENEKGTRKRYGRSERSVRWASDEFWSLRAREVSLLFRAGLISSTFYPTTGVGNDNFKVKGTGGMGVNIPFHSLTWSFEPALQYHSKGSEADNGLIGFSLHYLEMPLLFKVRFLHDTWSPILFFGPYLSYLLSASGYSNVLGAKTEQSIKDSLKEWDFGWMSGVGFDFDTGSRTRLGFHFMGSWGFIDVSDKGNSSTRNKQVGLLVNFYAYL